MLSKDNFLLWHGSQRWAGKPSIDTPRRGRSEHGAGLYCTTEHTTARKYAAGAGTTRLMHIRKDIVLLEDCKEDASELVRVAQSIPRLKSKQAIIDDISWCAERARNQTIGTNTLLNLASHHDALHGSAAVAISEWLVSKGIDASLYTRSSEDWLVIFNPNIIVFSEAISANEIDIIQLSLPRVRDMLAPSTLVETLAPSLD